MSFLRKISKCIKITRDTDSETDESSSSLSFRRLKTKNEFFLIVKRDQNLKVRQAGNCSFN